MAKEPGLGTSERYLIAAHRAAGWPIAPFRAKQKPWKQAIQPSMSKIPARPAARAVRIRKTGRALRPRTTPHSISFLKTSSTKGNQGCAATATAVRRCQAGSASRPRARFMLCGPKCAGPACPAMSNAAWHGGDMGFRRWFKSNPSSLRKQGPQRERNCAHRGAAAPQFGTVATGFQKNKNR